ncbi:MAG: hypothetical protein ACI97A_000399 [Planctomycetota bacterium]|jgi:hypothetical protein
MELASLMHLVKILLLLLAGIQPWAVTSSSFSNHPQDGPDVDLRVRIEAEQVEVQAIVNLAFCDEVIGSTRLDEEALTAEEVPVLTEALTEKFHESIRLHIDTIAVDPNSTVVELLPYEEADAEFFPTMGMKAVIKFKVTMSYSLKTTPRSVGLHWGLYPKNLALEEFVDETIKVNAEWTAGTDTKIIAFDESEPEYIWHAGKDGLAPKFLEVPKISKTQASSGPTTWWVPIMIWALAIAIWWIFKKQMPSLLILAVSGLACIALSIVLFRDQDPDNSGPPQLANDEAIETFNVLHANIYRAFDFTKENAIYDALSRSVEGDLLAEIYEQVYSSLILQDQGGAVCRVKKVTPVEVILIENQGDSEAFRVKSRWRVLGQVYHWGHTHMRTNEHLAEMSVRWSPTGWHIASSRVIEQFRVSGTTSEGSKR